MYKKALLGFFYTFLNEICSYTFLWGSQIDFEPINNLAEKKLQAFHLN